MIGPTRRRTRASRNSDAVVTSIEPGIYIGRVVSHLDRKFMGSLKVQILKITESGNEYQETNQLLTAHYASPFTGQTPLQNVGANNTYAESQQSYGFWAVPPDIGTKVIVLKIEGADDFGFWVGCIQDEFMNFMIPDGRPASVNNNSAEKLPVGEYNKAIVSPDGEQQPTRFPKPVNTDFVDALSEQGLIEDDIRGLTSSSARREVPSAVFGMSTPGPLDKRDGAPRAQRGPTGSEANVPSSRLGGTSIVMDDGDDKILRVGSPADTPSEYVDIENGGTGGDVMYPANELFRIRTRTGHQILLHNTEDLIYIGNSRGTTWIELTSNGKIDIYAEDSISVHTSQDLNFSADRDINFNATEQINMNAGKTIKTTAGETLDFTSIGYTSIVAGQSFSAKADTFASIQAGVTASIEAVNALSLVSSGASVNINAEGNANISGKAGVKIASNADAHMKIGGNIFNETNAYHINAQEYFLSTKGGLNLKSEADMFLNSNVTMNVKGKSTYVQSTSGDTHIKSSTDVKIQASGDINEYATSVLRNATANIQDRAGSNINTQALGGYIRANAATTMDIKSGTAMKLTGLTMDLKTTGGVLIAEASSELQLEGATVSIDAGNTASAATAGSAAIAKIAIGAIGASAATTAIKPNPVTPETPVISLIAKIPSRIPQHEPWLQHENLNPLEYTPDKTRAGTESVDSFVQPIPDTFVNIGNRTTAGTTTASDRGGYSGSQNYQPPTDGEYAEETLGDFQELKRDQIYVVGDSHAVGIQTAGGFQGSPSSGATVEQIASNQVGRIPDDTVVVVAAGNNNWSATPAEVQRKVQDDIIDPLLRKNCYVIFVVYPDIDLGGPYSTVYAGAGYTSNYNAVRTALNNVSANGKIVLSSADINPSDPMKIHATPAAYQRIVEATNGAISNIPDPNPFEQFSGTLGPLLAAIRIFEVDTPEPRSYDIVYGGIPEAIRPPRPITQMSVGDVLTWQRRIQSSVRSTATGAYQFIYSTLLDLVDRRRVVPRSATMDAATQDRLAIALMVGLEDWQAGQKSDEDFGYNLSRVWASMPVMKTGAPLNGGGTSNSVNNAYYGNVPPNPANARYPSYIRNDYRSSSEFLKDALVRSKRGEAGDNENTRVSVEPERLAALGFEAGDPYEELSARSTYTDAGSNIGDLQNVDRVRQRQRSATYRYLPVQQRLIDVLNRAAAAAGVYVHITSGGQMPYAEWERTPGRTTRGRTSSGNPKYFFIPGSNGQPVPVRTGSRRHDTGLAADLYITRDADPNSQNSIPFVFSQSNSSENNEIWRNFIYHCFKFGCRGFGFSAGYMGDKTIHLDLLGAVGGSGYNSNVVGHWETASWVVQIAQDGLNAA